MYVRSILLVEIHTSLEARYDTIDRKSLTVRIRVGPLASISDCRFRLVFAGNCKFRDLSSRIAEYLFRVSLIPNDHVSVMGRVFVPARIGRFVPPLRVVLSRSLSWFALRSRAVPLSMSVGPFDLIVGNVVDLSLESQLNCLVRDSVSLDS
jgi:hypothetical protein